MEILNKIVTILEKSVGLIVSIFLIVISLIGIYAVYDYHYVNKKAELSGDIITLMPKEKDESFDLAKMKKINQDIIGWIKINNTKIDYPVVKSKDNNEYLTLNYKKEYSISGSIFLDKRNKEDFSNEYSIIYGHNMPNGSMFGGIKKYRDSEYFYSHIRGILYTEKPNHFDIIGYMLIHSTDEMYNLDMTKQELYNYFKENAQVFNAAILKEDDTLIVLSTCDKVNRSDRTVLLIKYNKAEE